MVIVEGGGITTGSIGDSNTVGWKNIIGGTNHTFFSRSGNFEKSMFPNRQFANRAKHGVNKDKPAKAPKQDPTNP